jgi:glycerophosphoryl diester phosphodiesterase
MVIAHRGDSFYRPENTLASFASAVELGVEMVELDVQVTRDGHVVVIHDATVDRTTNGRGLVAEMTLAELRRFSAGYPERFGEAYAGERIPTLAEVMGLLRGRGRILIEIKPDAVTADAEGGVEALTIAEARKAGMDQEVALISFSRTALLRCRALAPEIMRGHLFYQAGIGDVIEGAREIASELVMPFKEMLSTELRDRAREAGLKVATWVVDDPAELPGLVQFDLYGIGSNRPGVMMEALGEIER